MLALLLNLLATLRSALRTRAELALENLLLRQQLATLRRSSPRAHLRLADRAFWIALSQVWSHWADALVIVKPDTVVRWHRAGFRLFWKWKSRSRTPAKDDVPAEVKQLIRRMAESNVGWGAPRIHGELLKLGIEISERSVSRFMPKRERKPPSQTWRTFDRRQYRAGSDGPQAVIDSNRASLLSTIGRTLGGSAGGSCRRPHWCMFGFRMSLCGSAGIWSHSVAGRVRSAPRAWVVG